VSSRSLSFLAARLREHRRRIGSRWPALDRTSSLAGAGSSAQRDHVRPARSGFRGRDEYGLPLHQRGRRPAGRTRPDPRRGCPGCLGESVRPARRDTSADRPDRGRPAPLLRQAQETRHERPGHRRRVRTPAGPHLPCRVPSTTSRPHAPTASSKLSPKPASGRGPTRDIRELGGICPVRTGPVPWLGTGLVAAGTRPVVMSLLLWFATSSVQGAGRRCVGGGQQEVSCCPTRRRCVGVLPAQWAVKAG